MNYPNLVIVESPQNIMPSEKLVDLKKAKKNAILDGIGDVRIGGDFKDKSIFIANPEELRNYDFVLGIDNRGCLVVVPLKK